MASIIVEFGLIGMAYLVSIGLLLWEFPLSDLSNPDDDLN